MFRYLVKTRTQEIFKFGRRNFFNSKNGKNHRDHNLIRSQYVGFKQLNFYSLRWTTLLAFFWPLKKQESDKEQVKAAGVAILENDLKEADQLYDNEQYSECYDQITKAEASFPNNVELLWRKSRVLYQMASAADVPAKQKHQLANEAFSTISSALASHEDHYAVHKWMSVILDLKTSCDGLKERIRNLENVKKHMMRAVELNPKDATTLYMLGEWCYRIADMPWYQRRIAQTIFATPPTSSYDEAILYFSRAEIVEPRFYSMNLLMLGKTYLKLGKEDIAKYYLNLALSYPARTNDDHHANKEAQEVLKHFK